jgi:hypothetical protein
MWTIVAIIVFVVVGLVVNYLRGQARKALAQNVFSRGNHARGQSATTEIITFHAPQTPADIVGYVVQTLALATVAPPVVARLHLVGADERSAIFAFGNKFSESFRSAFVVDALPTGGSSAAYTVLTWTEGDGIVAGIPEMELLANSIRACASNLGGSFVEAAVAQTVPAIAVAPEPALAAAPAPAPVAALSPYCTACGSAQVGSRFCTECGADRY